MRLMHAIVFVSDMRRSVAFYRDVMGIPVRFESSHWSELETQGATLALHLADDGAAAGGDKHAGACHPGLRTRDLDAFHARMLAAGVPCVQAPRDVFGTRIAQYRDPDGLIVSVGEGN